MTGPIPHHLTVEALAAPVDIESPGPPRLAWRVGSGLQAAYQIQVRPAGSGIEGVLWDSGKVVSARSTNVPYLGPELAAAADFGWRVRTWDSDDLPSGWSTDTSFGTAPCGWSEARPIWATAVVGEEEPDWAFLRTEIDLTAERPIRWAHLYATGASTEPGRQFVYKLWVNGQYVGVGPTRPIGNETRFDGYDVTALLRVGPNAVGALAHTTSDRRFAAFLVVEFVDGARASFGTSEGWQALDGSEALPATGSIGTSYFDAPQENFDARHYPHHFSEPGSPQGDSRPAATKQPFTQLRPTVTAKVRRQLERPAAVVEYTPGNYLVDYHRTWVGGLSLQLAGQPGQQVEIRYGQVTDSPTSVRYRTSAGNTYVDRWTLSDEPVQLETWGLRVSATYRSSTLQSGSPATTSRPCLRLPAGGRGELRLQRRHLERHLDTQQAHH